MAQKSAKTRDVSEKTKKAAKVERAKAAEPKRLSALDAAAKVLVEASQPPMNCKERIEQMAAKGYWTSPVGQTPWATLYSALKREIAKKGEQSRFVQTDPGRFALAKSRRKAASGATEAALALHTE